MPKKRERVVVSPGVNAVSCGHCDDGTMFIPITMTEMAKLRNGYTMEVTAICHIGHRQNIKLIAWPLTWGKMEFSRT